MKKVVNRALDAQRGAVPAWIDRRFLLVLGLVGALAAASYAAAPGWWTARGIFNDRAASDYAVVNQGQLKNMAKAARDEMVAKGFFQATDANAINALVNGWIANKENATDYAPANLGQLKAVARPFYDALYLDRPWPAAATTTANDYAVANIGQLKAVFAFNVEPFDSDGDGLPDGWERKVFGSLDRDGSGDFDGDGLSDAQEFALGTSAASQDTDGDSMPDGWEQLYALNPLDPADAGPAQDRVIRPDPPPIPENWWEWDDYFLADAAHAALIAALDRTDPDKDGLSNRREHAAGTHPRIVSTDGDLYSDYEEIAYGSDPLLAASIPPVRAEFAEEAASLLKVSTFRAEHAVGGEVVTLAGPPGTLFFPTGPGGVLTEGQVTVTTDPVSHFATVYVFSPRGVPGSQNITLTGALAGTPAAPSHTIAAQEWRGNLASSLDPTLPAPTPFSPPPPEGVVFTAHRHRKVGYSGQQEVFAQTEVTGSPSPVTTEWFKPGEEGPRPPYSDDGFNGDADLLGDNSDPGDPRDSISWGSGPAVPASEGDPLAYPVSSGGEVPTRVVGPYGAPGPMMGTYTATDAYSPPGKATSTGGSFEAAKAVSTLESIGYSQWGANNGWQGNGELGVKAYTVSSTFTEGTGVAQEVVYEGSGGQMESSTATYATQSATMEQMEVRLQTNKDVEAGKPVSQVFLLTKSIVEGETTTSEFVAALRLTINSGKTSDACEITAGALPPDVTTQGGVVSMRSPAPAAGKTCNYILQPFEVVSRDKFLAGSFDIPPEWDNLAIEFIGPGGENLGKYDKLLGGGSTKIYNHVTEILSDADIDAGGQPPNQKVWFVREGADSRRISYYTCFNSVGQVQIKLYPFVSGEAFAITHELSAAEDFAGVIAYVDAWVKGTSFNWTVSPALLPPPVLVLASAAADDPSAAGLSPTMIASSLASGAIITAEANVPLTPSTVNLALGQPLADLPALGGMPALQVLPLGAIQPQSPLVLVPGTVYWLVNDTLYPLTDEQVTALSGQAGSVTLAVPPPPRMQTAADGFAFGSVRDSGPIDDLTRAVLIPFFLVINQVEGLGSVAVGLFDGVKGGLQDDWEFLELIVMGGINAGSWAFERAKTEIKLWKENPLTRARHLKQMADQLCEDWVFKPLAEYWEDTGEDLWHDLCTWEGFKRRSLQVWQTLKGRPKTHWVVAKNVRNAIVRGLTSWADDFCARMMDGAEKAHWDSMPWVENDLLSEVGSIQRQACYTFGYTFGFLCEQVAVGLLTDGAMKMAQIAVKGSAHLAANLAKRTAASVAARAQWLKRLLAEAGVGDALLREAYERGLVKCFVEPVGPTIKEVISEVLEKAFSKEAFNRSIYSWKHLQDDILQRPNLSKLVKQAGGEAVFQRRLSQLATILGEEFDAMAAKNFAKVADEIILVPKPDGTVDEFFEAFFRAFEGNPALMVGADAGATVSKSSLSAEGKATLKKFLSDPNAGKLWEIDVPAIVENEPAIPHNYWIRGVLAELGIYKRVYKDAGYLHAPTAAAFDFKSVLEYVQIKSLKNPDGALDAMKEAARDLVALPSPPNAFKLHILKKPGSGSDQLKDALQEYIDDPDGPIKGRVKLLIEEFELTP